MNKLHDVGVIVARFQVDELHPGQLMLLNKVKEECHKVIVFLGVPPTKSTREDPLPFQARRLMVEEHFPDMTVLYIKDRPTDDEWSKALDEQIEDHTSPNHDVMLYGSRASFIARYFGKHSCTDVDDDGFKMYSGTAVRHRASIEVDNNRSWRKGAIWATHNTYQTVYPTVDMAIFSQDRKKILMGRKPNEKLLRLPGGFVSRLSEEGAVPGALEDNAVREAHEECGSIELAPLEFVGSCQMNDWRYGASCRIITTLFATWIVFGKPKAGDDLEYLEWVDFEPDKLRANTCETHQPLITMLLEKFYAL